MASYQVQIQSICKQFPCSANLRWKISNWAQLIIASFSSAVRVAKCYFKNQNIFVGCSEMLKKIIVKSWTLSRIVYKC